MAIPKYHELFNPILSAMHSMGASASIQELNDLVAESLGLSDSDPEETKPNGQPAFAYRMAWARSYLKAVGLLNNSQRGVWSLTPEGGKTRSVVPDEVKRAARAASAARRQSELDGPDNGDSDGQDLEGWRKDLLVALLELDPDQFERLCQRVLRESGFTEVKVTGRAGDGGIDGTGLVRIGGLLSFPILFQCKRYKGSVGPGVVRDFRGAMVGRSDRGLVLTTGVFTREARLEAKRDGAPPIDLVDRDALIDKLVEFRLGVQIEVVEQITVDPSWVEAL